MARVPAQKDQMWNELHARCNTSTLSRGEGEGEGEGQGEEEN